jgi:hypothetical protein
MKPAKNRIKNASVNHLQPQAYMDKHLVAEAAEASYADRRSPYQAAVAAEASYEDHRMPFPEARTESQFGRVK